MKRVLITGANGQLGSEIKLLADTCNAEFYFTDVDDLDITDIDAIRQFLKEKQITTIVNCAAYTAVDKAEDEPEKARLINEYAPAYLAELAYAYDVELIHISTDYVFDGESFKPYKETDFTNPQSVYGKTKLGGEGRVMAVLLDKAVIIRTSWLYSAFGHNFVKTIMKYAKERGDLRVVFDQIGTPTNAADLARFIIEIIENDNYIYGIYHFSNEGVCSWYDFAKEIVEIAEIKCNITPVESHEFPTKAKRPFYSVLNKTKVKQTFNIEIPYWKDSLTKTINQLKRQ